MRMLFVCAIVALAACRARDPSFRSESGERLSDFDPLPFSVAIAPLDSKILLTGEIFVRRDEKASTVVTTNWPGVCLMKSRSIRIDLGVCAAESPLSSTSPLFSSAGARP